MKNCMHHNVLFSTRLYQNIANEKADTVTYHKFEARIHDFTLEYTSIQNQKSYTDLWVVCGYFEKN